GPIARILPPTESPLDHRQGPDLVACVGALVYVDHDPLRPSLASSLRAWAAEAHLDATAFAAVYADATAAADHAGDIGGEPVVSPLRLGEAQIEALRRARHEPVTVITGPPGSGKSQAVAAIAVDTVAHGRSVLVATRSGHAAGVVAGLLARQPGPDPVRFGGTDHDDLVARVGETGTGRDEIAAAHDDLRAALDRQRLVEDGISEALALERRAEQADHWDGLVDRLSSLAPAAFDPACPSPLLRELTELSERAGRVATGSGPGAWWARRRRTRSARRLAADLGSPPGTLLVDLCTALECAGDRRARAQLEARGGTLLGPHWDLLAGADGQVRAAAGRLVAALGASEQRRQWGRRAAGDLGAALRAGRRQRRQLLGRIDGPALVAALPLWVGTLREIEDLLPDTPGLFDLVVLDEASQIDQAAAAGALLRGRRAVVVGDPRQLRHVSFVGDDDLVRAQREHDVGPWAARLDVRRTSVLDLAAGRAATTALDEHHRSVPHLVDFPARAFYGGRVQVATRHPANEATDVIDVVRPAAGEDEVAAALAAVARLAAAGRRDIAVISPFREPADAAQQALLAAYEVDEIERLGLRVGTVHAFQGAEADHVVLALGLAPDDPPGRRRFVEDPHLFNVMVTRARRSLVIVTSLPTPAGPPDGLVERYLVHADRPPSPPADGPCPTAWGDALALELREAGLVVRTGYPVGRWAVDLCIGEGAGTVGVETAVHSHGAAAHVARRRALAAAGWRLVDGWPTRWDHDPTRAAVELATTVPDERPVAAD
ncbi:MAG TPA: AAA domain-containing protein, partial [Acidimicrobiales bacterium]|nr:AAA domain-containing protein [Acidimicrobiales bacterium]